jgi:ketosteroid isomerase-like protein
MSERKIEIARRGIDAFNRGDAEALFQIATDDIELFSALTGAVEEGDFQGGAGLEAYFEIMAATWGEFRILPEEFRDLDDRLLVLGRAWGLGKGSRVPVEAPHAIVMEFRGEHVWRIHSYLDPSEALQDVARSTQSRESVDVVLRWLLAFGRDRRAFSDVTHPEVEWMPFEENHRPSHGVDGALRLRDEWLGAWDEQSIKIDEIWGQQDAVFVAATVVCRGGASDVPIEIRFYGHCRVRDRKVSYCYEHLNRDAALRAMRLSE